MARQGYEVKPLIELVRSLKDNNMWIGNYNNGMGIRAIDRTMTKVEFKKHWRVLRLMIKRLGNAHYNWRFYYDNLYVTVTQREINNLKGW